MEELRERIARRLREARERVGITQSALAAQAGFAAMQTISQIELGQREVKAVELSKLARVLSVSIQDLLGEDPIARSVVLWRETPREEAGAKQALFVQRHRRFCNVQRATGSRPTLEPPRLVRPIAELTYRDVEELAEAVRAQWRLGDRPAFALLEKAEAEQGIQIWYADLNHDGSAAAYVDEDGAGVLLSSTEPPWRRAFSFAHELFHVLTWNLNRPEEVDALAAGGELFTKSERLANAFASALLLPEHPLRASLADAERGELSLASITAIAADYGVSVQALMWRLVNLKVLPKATVEALLESPDLSDQNARPRPGTWWSPPPLPQRYVHMCYHAWQQGHLSRHRLADYLETDLVGLDDRLTEYGLSAFQEDEATAIISGSKGTEYAGEEQEWPVTVPGA